jgi:hypothetical protein
MYDSRSKYFYLGEDLTVRTAKTASESRHLRNN